MARFITKRIDTRKPQKKLVEECVNKDNNKIKNKADMKRFRKTTMARKPYDSPAERVKIAGRENPFRRS